jgi:hypothetical protein
LLLNLNTSNHNLCVNADTTIISDIISEVSALKAVLFGALLQQHPIHIESLHKVVKVPNIEFKVLGNLNKLTPFPHRRGPVLLHVIECGDENLTLFRQGEITVLLSQFDLPALGLEGVDVVAHLVEGIEETLLHKLGGFLGSESVT